MVNIKIIIIVIITAMGREAIQAEMGDWKYLFNLILSWFERK